MQTLVLEGTDRETRGKGPARRTRLTGMVPAVLYGGKGKSISLAVNAKQVAKILRSESGHNSIFTIQLSGGKEEQAMVKDWQVDPVTGALIHVDLYRLHTNPPGQSGDGMANAGIVLGFVGLATLLVVIVLLIAATHSNSPTY
jgi:ribosomal protein L25 (general stress protein Ctc)